MHAVSCNTASGGEERNGQDWSRLLATASFQQQLQEEETSGLVEITKHLEIITAGKQPAQTHKHTDTLSSHPFLRDECPRPGTL